MDRYLNCLIRFNNIKSTFLKSYVKLNLKAGYCQNNIVTESEITSQLRQKFPNAKSIIVQDISGGCGAMFNITIETNEFNNLSIMKQHRLVYDTLKEQIKHIHGLHLETKPLK